MDLGSEVEKVLGAELHTLDQRKPFIVLEFYDDRIIVKNSKGKERPIRWKEIQQSWNHLEKHKTITRDEIQTLYSSHNSAYVTAIIAQVSGVSCQTSPIILRLK